MTLLAHRCLWLTPSPLRQCKRKRWQSQDYCRLHGVEDGKLYPLLRRRARIVSKWRYKKTWGPLYVASELLDRIEAGEGVALGDGVL